MIYYRLAKDFSQGFGYKLQSHFLIFLFTVNHFANVRSASLQFQINMRQRGMTQQLNGNCMLSKHRFSQNVLFLNPNWEFLISGQMTKENNEWKQDVYSIQKKKSFLWHMFSATLVIESLTTIFQTSWIPIRWVKL